LYSYGGSIEEVVVLDKRFNAKDRSLYAFMAWFIGIIALIVYSILPIIVIYLKYSKKKKKKKKKKIYIIINNLFFFFF